MMSSVIDAHLHDFDIMRVDKRPPNDVANEVIKSMDEIGVSKVLMIALEVDASKIIRNVRYRDVIKGLEEAIGYGSLRIPPMILEALNEKEKATLLHSNHIKRAMTPTERVVKIAKHSHGRIVPIGNLRLPIDKEEVEFRLNGMYRDGVKGIKIYPTLQFINPSDRRLYHLYKTLISYDIPLLIHTGCDPGFWELPNLCEWANPKRAEKMIRKFGELKVILCHMGAYSALRPGIFYREAVELARNYRNVYLDTSAVDPYLILDAIKRVGSDKLIFGTDHPVLGTSWERLIYMVSDLPLDNSIKEDIMYNNAVRVFGL